MLLVSLREFLSVCFWGFSSHFASDWSVRSRFYQFGSDMDFVDQMRVVIFGFSMFGILAGHFVSVFFYVYLRC